MLDGDGLLWFADEATHREACAVVLAALDGGEPQVELDSRLGYRESRVIEGEWTARTEET